MKSWNIISEYNVIKLGINKNNNKKIETSLCLKPRNRILIYPWVKSKWQLDNMDCIIIKILHIADVVLPVLIQQIASVSVRDSFLF